MASTYEVRVTKYGKGRLEYRAGTSFAQLRGWQDWQSDDLYLQMKYISKRHDTTWCGIAPNQMIRVRVRAVDEQGNPGPSSKPRKVFIPG